MLARMHRTYRDTNRKAARFTHLLRPNLCDARILTMGRGIGTEYWLHSSKNDFILGSSLVGKGADSPVSFVWLRFPIHGARDRSINSLLRDGRTNRQGLGMTF